MVQVSGNLAADALQRGQPQTLSWRAHKSHHQLMSHEGHFEASPIEVSATILQLRQRC
jgi:hypothetical protein